MSYFRRCDRDTPYLLPPSVDEWLPKDHLARFVVDIVEQLDLSALTRQYRGAGSAAYHPGMLVALLLYGYATGTYSSRRIEQATYESLAFRYIAANTHPDHDTLCAFRTRFLRDIEQLFVQVLCIAQQMKLLKLGTVALDGTKLHANASRHSALSYGPAERIEAQLAAEVKVLARSEAADAEPLPEGLNIPEELARREERLKTPPSALPTSRPGMKRSARRARNKPNGAVRNRAAVPRHRPRLAHVPRTKSISPIRASCRHRAVLLSRATTRKRPSIPTRCWCSPQS